MANFPTLSYATTGEIASSCYLIPKPFSLYPGLPLYVSPKLAGKKMNTYLITRKDNAVKQIVNHFKK